METMRATEIFNNDTFKLIAVESVDFQSNQTHASYRAYGRVEPVAIIVCAPTGISALDMLALPTAIEPLRQNIPELDALITAFNPR